MLQMGRKSALKYPLFLQKRVVSAIIPDMVKAQAQYLSVHTKHGQRDRNNTFRHPFPPKKRAKTAFSEAMPYAGFHGQPKTKLM